jgi:hypothetical protein
MNLENLSQKTVVIPKSINKLNYFRGVVLKEITNFINEYQGDIVLSPDYVLEEIIKPKFYFEWVYDAETDKYSQVNLSLKDISDGRLYQLINDSIIWAEMTFNREISKPQ